MKKLTVTCLHSYNYSNQKTTITNLLTYHPAIPPHENIQVQFKGYLYGIDTLFLPINK